MSAAPTWPRDAVTTVTRLRPGQTIMVLHRSIGLVVATRSDKAADRRAAFPAVVRRITRQHQPGYTFVVLHTDHGQVVPLPPNTSAVVIA